MNLHTPCTPLHTVPEVAVYLVVSIPTVYRFLRSGRLRAVKVGGQWRVSDEALRAFLRDRIYID